MAALGAKWPREGRLEQPSRITSTADEAGAASLDGGPGAERTAAGELPADPRSAPEVDAAASFVAWIHGALAYVPSVARRYLGCGIPFEDLLAAGNLGLVEAAMRFDPARNVKFVTYADWWIRKAILTAIEEQAGPVRLPRYRQEQLRHLHDARATLRLREEREPDVAELARATGLSAVDVEKLLGISRQSISLEQPGHADGERPLHEVLAAEMGRGPHEVLLEEDSSRRLRRLVASLGPREQAVLTLRYGLAGNPPLTLRDVGRTLSVSRERVRQIEHRALLHLRRMLQSA